MLPRGFQTLDAARLQQLRNYGLYKEFPDGLLISKQARYPEIFKALTSHFPEFFLWTVESGLAFRDRNPSYPSLIFDHDEFKYLPSTLLCMRKGRTYIPAGATLGELFFDASLLEHHAVYPKSSHLSFEHNRLVLGACILHSLARL